MESQNNHHFQAENAFQESGPNYYEEKTLASPTPAAILKRLRLGRPSLLLEMDETQLFAALESTEWQVRVAAVKKLEAWGELAPIERLTRALKDEHEAVRAAAAHALGVLGNPEAIRALVDALQDSTWLVRAAAIQALGMLGEQAPVEPLMLALHDEDESVRAVAVRVSGTMGERFPIESLLEALHDKSWQVREMTVLAMGERGGYIPRTVLELALQDEDESVRRAVHFLQEMYPDRCVETVASHAASVSEESTELAIDSLQHAPLQHYPRRAALRVLRLALLACWSIFLGYVTSIIWNLVQLTHANQAKLTVHFVVQALSAPLTALAGYHISAWVPGVCMLLALLLFFGCLWAARDSWNEYKWMHGPGVGDEELEIVSGDYNQFTHALINPPQQIHATRLFSRRRVLVGLTTVLIVGNGIAWSVLLNSKRKQGSSGHGLGTVLSIYRKHTGGVRSVAWSPDGTRIASGSDDKTIQVWDVANGDHSLTFSSLDSTVLAVAWSPNGRRIASGKNDGTIQVWDVSIGRNVFTYEHARTPYGAPADYAVAALAWSPDGSHIASAIFGSPNGLYGLVVWDAVNGGQSFSDFNSFGGVLAVTWSPDGKRITTANNDETIQISDASTGRNVFSYGVHADYKVTAAACSRDGKYVAFGIDDKTVQVWDASSGEHIYTYRGHYNALLGLITAVAWSPDGRRIASGSADKTVQLWDAVSGEHVYIYRGHRDAVTSIAWSPDGKYVASGSDDKTVQVWDAG